MSLEGVYIHLNVAPKNPELRTPENPSTEQWLQITREWYRFVYTYYERSDEEYDWSNLQGDWIKENIPEEYKIGVHLIDPEGGFMGEDVYVSDGYVCHTIHVKCLYCKKYNLISRGDKKWCVSCKAYRY